MEHDCDVVLVFCRRLGAIARMNSVVPWRIYFYSGASVYNSKTFYTIFLVSHHTHPDLQQANPILIASLTKKNVHDVVSHPYTIADLTLGDK